MAAGATLDDETNFFQTKNVAVSASLQRCLLISWQFFRCFTLSKRHSGMGGFPDSGRFGAKL
jgi:hypothetical protein